MDDFIANLDSVIKDPRSVEEKERDYKTSDIAPGAIDDEVVWLDESEVESISYTPREQSWSLSCMAQAAAKGYEIINKIKNALSEVFSAHPPYRSRSNYPDGGMWLQNLLDIMKKVGTTYESLDKSQGIGESEINRDITVETPYKISGYGFPDKQNNIDDIAKAIKRYGHCLILIHANKQEYTKPIPEFLGLPIEFGHGICGTQFYKKNGVKVIKIEDSTGHSTTADGKGKREFTEEFISKRCSGSGYMLVEEPKYLFKTFMRKGMISIEIKELQKRLNKEGFGTLTVDGSFGFRTNTAVKNYQKAHNLLADGLVGAKTRIELNK